MAQRLFFTAPNGEEGTQLQVHTDGQGAVRQEASAITTDDLPPGIGFPAGSFIGQAIAWNGTEWIPLGSDEGNTTLRVDAVGPPDGSAAQALFGPGGVFISGETAQLNDSLANVSIRATTNEWQAGFSDGSTFTQIIGTPTTITLNSYTADGRIDLNSHGVNQSMLDGWSVVLGEGGDSVGLDLIAGFTVLVEPGLDIQLLNSGSQYSLQLGSHVFRSPNLLEVPTNNVQISSNAGEMSIGVLGAGPQIRQVITGATTQDQVDSLVAALVAFGFVSDGR